MVVLAASVVTKTGKPLVSRQFVDMSRIRIEGLLAAFPKLVGNGKQHTYVETENVRYVYQPMEALYLLLITNKGSNILEDLETLRLLAKIVPEYVHPMDEEGILNSAFDLIFAFDEVIAMGYRESITVTQVRQNTAMESHEEKLHKMIIQSKINDTKDVMKRKAIEIDKQKLANEARVREARGPASYIPTPAPARSSRLDDDNTPTFSRPEPSIFGKPEGKKGPSKGMQLGKGKKGASDFLDSLRAEGENVDVSRSARGTAAASDGPSAAPQRPSEPISITLEETVRAVLNNEGPPVEEILIEGTVSLQAQSEQDACVVVEVQHGANRGYNFKTHPNIDKNLYAQQNLLGAKDPDRPFPVGSSVGILRWHLKSDNEDNVPFTVNAWPSVSGSETYVSMEYECKTHLELHDVTIAIPLPPLSSAPRISQVEGDTHYDGRRGQLLWTMDLIDDSNRQGALEFVIPASAGGSFLPITVNFTSSETLCDLTVRAVVNAKTEAPVRYSSRTQLTADRYEVV